LKNSNNNILIFGDLMIDEYWYSNVTRISPEAPVPIAHINHNEIRLGGAANVANNLSAFGSKIELCGVVGKDTAAKILKDMCIELNIIPRFITVPEIPTTKKLRIVSSGHHMMRCDFEGTFTGSLIKLINFNEMILSSKIIVFSDYHKGALNNITEMLKICKSHNKISIVDPKSENLSDYQYAYILKPNYKEFRKLFKCKINETEIILTLLNKYQIEHLIVTCGSEGVMYFDRSVGQNKIEAIPVEVYDVTGAGDTFNAALTYAIICKNEMLNAIKFANACAGTVVQKRGTSILSLSEVNNLKSIWL
jgi:rfaE bifunctional protein kinase chain/domain